MVATNSGENIRKTLILKGISFLSEVTKLFYNRLCPWLHEDTNLIHLKWVNCRVYEFYFDKAAWLKNTKWNANSYSLQQPLPSVRSFWSSHCFCKVRDHNPNRLLFENGTPITLPQKNLGNLFSVTESKDTYLAPCGSLTPHWNPHSWKPAPFSVCSQFHLW